VIRAVGQCWVGDLSNEAPARVTPGGRAVAAGSSWVRGFCFIHLGEGLREIFANAAVALGGAGNELTAEEGLSDSWRLGRVGFRQSDQPSGHLDKTSQIQLRQSSGLLTALGDREGQAAPSRAALGR
jgi:hypothetical protein